MADEAHLHVVNLTRTVLGDNEQRQAAYVVALGILPAVEVILGSVDEAYDVGILLDGPRFTEVAQLGSLGIAVCASAFHRTVELRQGDYRDVQLLG